MMTLDIFNEQILTGKTVEELYELVEDFKIEKIFLKVQIEQKNSADFTLPPEEMLSKINHYRLYIRDTYKHIEKISGTVKRADDDAFAFKFQENICNVEKLDYSIGGYFGGFEDYTLTFEDERILVSKNGQKVRSSIDKKTFLKELSKLHIGEWRELYLATDYGQEVIDGTSWGINIHFTDEIKTIEFGGTNAFPYNFGTFNQLIENALNE